MKKLISLFIITVLLFSYFNVSADDDLLIAQYADMKKIFSDRENWVYEDKSLTFDNNSFTHEFKSNNLIVYSAQTYLNDIFCTKMIFQYDNTQVLRIRSQSSEEVNNTCYEIKISKENIIVERVIAMGVTKLVTVQNTIPENKEVNIEYGAINTDDGVQIILNYNDENLINISDNVQAIRTAGIISFNNSSVLKVAAGTPSNVLRTLPLGLSLKKDNELSRIAHIKISSIDNIENITYKYYLSDDMITNDNQLRYDLPNNLKLIEDEKSDQIKNKSEHVGKYLVGAVEINNNLYFTHQLYIDPAQYLLSKDIIMMIDVENAFVNGSFVQIDENDPYVTPSIIDNRTLVPIRFIAESLDGEVSWDENTEQITINLGENQVALRIGEKYLSVNGSNVEIDVAPQIMYERTMVPLRAISNAFGKKVFWDNKGLIIISEDEIKLDSGKDEEIVDSIISYIENGLI